MEDYEGARGGPRVPRRAQHGPPPYQPPMYNGAYGARGMPPYPPPSQGPPAQPPHGMPPPSFPPGPMGSAYPHRPAREWDGPPPFDDSRPDFKRRRFNDSYQGGPPIPPSAGGLPPPQMGFPPAGGGYPPSMGVPPGMPPPQLPLPQQPFSYGPSMGPQVPPGGQPGGMRGMGGEAFRSLPPPPRREHALADRRADAPPPAGGQAPRDARANGEGEEPMTFQEYMAMKPRNISPQAAQEAYECYKREFLMQKPNRFFDEHMEEEWFRERYDPQYVRNRVERVEVEVADRAKEFRRIWDEGGSRVCAPSLETRKGRRGAGQEGDAIVEKRPLIMVEDRKGDAKAAADVDDSGKEEPSAAAVQVADAKIAFEEVKEGGKTGEDVKQDAAGDAMVVTDELKEGETKREDEVEADVKMEKKEEEPKASEEFKPETKDEAVDRTSNVCVKEEEATESVKTDPNSDSVTAVEESVEAKLEKSDGEADTKSESIATEQNDATDENAEVKDESKVEVKETPLEGSVCPPTTAPTDKEKSTGSEKEARERADVDLCLPLRRQHQKDTIFMRGIPRNLSRNALVKILVGGADGTADLALRRLKLGDINPHRSLQRFGWAVYDSEETAKRALDIVRGTVVRSSDCCNGGEDERKKLDDDQEATYTIDCMLNMERRRKFTEGRTLPIAFAETARMKDDSVQAVRIMRHLDTLRKMPTDLNPFTDAFLSSLPSDLSRLEHVASYLREVHYFCYYSGNEFLEDPTSMPPQELLPAFHADRAYAKVSEADARMVRRVDERAKWVLERDYDRPRSNGDNGDATRARRLQAWLDANTKDEGNGRFRCRLPPKKLFKAPSFVHKHLRSKHPDAVADIHAKADLETYRANFENDASKAEVVSIFCQGVAPADEFDDYAADAGAAGGGGGGGGPMAGGGGQAGFPQTGGMGMYGAPGAFMGMGMQYPMMMMPQAGATGFPQAAYGGGFQQGGMGFQGNAMGMGGMMPMQQPTNGGGGGGGGGGGYRGRPARPRERDGGRHGRGGWRGGRNDGGYDDDRGGESSPPKRQRREGRAKGKRYNDLDAPADGPGIDLVSYDNI